MTLFALNRFTGIQQPQMNRAGVSKPEVSAGSPIDNDAYSAGDQFTVSQRPVTSLKSASLQFAGFGEQNDPNTRVRMTAYVFQGFLANLDKAAKRAGNMSRGDYLQMALPGLMPTEMKKIVPSRSDILTAYRDADKTQPVKTTVHSLIGGEQIFDAWNQFLDKTEKHAFISMYDFENILAFSPENKVRGDAIDRLLIEANEKTGVAKDGRGSDGAEPLPAWSMQQALLKKIISKAAQGAKMYFILDNSVQYLQDEGREPVKPRPLNNEKMIQFLRYMKTEEAANRLLALIAEEKRKRGLEPEERQELERMEAFLKQEKHLPIEVVPYPRSLARIYHVKALLSDDTRAIIGGMNLSNHSSANWDACVAIEGDEVANLVSETFRPDWIMSRLYQRHNLTNVQVKKWLNQAEEIPPEVLQSIGEFEKELPESKPLAAPAIKTLNTFPREYALIGSSAKEEIYEYLASTLQRKDLNGLYSEQFIASYPEMLDELVGLHRSGNTDVKMIHSGSVIDQFPFTRKGPYNLMRNGVPLRFFNERADIGEKLHAKWTEFTFGPEKGKVTGYETLIGSANMSRVAMRSNDISGGTRGNRDMAIVVPSRRIGEAFKEQFDIDFADSPPRAPEGYGQYEMTLPPSSYGTYAALVQQRLNERIKGLQPHEMGGAQ